MKASRAYLSLAAVFSTAAASGPTARIDLAQAFGTRVPWQFTAEQGAEVPDPILGDDMVPGAIRLCISGDGGHTCGPDLTHVLGLPSDDDIYATPHFLDTARIVRSRLSGKLLLLQVGSLHSVNGNQRRATVALAYDRASDDFAIVYTKQTGRNNNQEIRYIAGGPLDGAIVSAEPTDDAPFGFWITVDRRAAAGYRPILRYRSATRYGDGNRLAVIDSEMPGIERRLGLWRAGAPLPLPPGRCARPHLARGALWC